jgi:hypothetical protein
MWPAWPPLGVLTDRSIRISLRCGHAIGMWPSSPRKLSVLANKCPRRPFDGPSRGNRIRYVNGVVWIPSVGEMGALVYLGKDVEAEDL